MSEKTYWRDTKITASTPVRGFIGASLVDLSDGDLGALYNNLMSYPQRDKGLTYLSVVSREMGRREALAAVAYDGNWQTGEKIADAVHTITMQSINTIQTVREKQTMSQIIYAQPLTSGTHLANGSWLAEALAKAGLGDGLPINLGTSDIPTLRGMAAMVDHVMPSGKDTANNPFEILIDLIEKNGVIHVYAEG